MPAARLAFREYPSILQAANARALSPALNLAVMSGHDGVQNRLSECLAAFTCVARSQPTCCGLKTAQESTSEVLH